MSVDVRPRVVLGLQGAQMPANAIRGIGRWMSCFVQGLVRNRRDLIAAVSIDRRLPIPEVVSLLPEDVPVLVSEERPPVGDSERLVFHAASIFEDLELDRVWPPWAQDPSVALVVTMYDTIPALFPDDYFQGPLRFLLESRYELLRRADAILADSVQTGRDTARLLDVDSTRIFVAPVELPGRFRPHAGGRAAAQALLPEELGIEPNFVLSIGNVDPRKNLAALLRAYACLPPTLRERHQLVLTCSQADDGHLALLRAMADAMGIGDRTVLTSFVDEDTMIRLYQACHTMVFPSLYEGLGLPAIEAMRCGACTLVSGTSALREVVHDPCGWFDPGDVADIGRVLRQALEDDEFADNRRAQAASDARHYRWDRADGPVVAAYHLAAQRRP